MLVRRVPAIVLSLALGAAALVSAPIALASDGGSATDNNGPVRKDCENSSSVRLNVKGIDGNADRFEVIGAVFSADDDTWEWKLRHDGDVSAQGEVRARNDIDRSFRISRTMLDFPGNDNVSFRAENQRTGEVCRVQYDY